MFRGSSHLIDGYQPATTEGYTVRMFSTKRIIDIISVIDQTIITAVIRISYEVVVFFMINNIVTEPVTLARNDI